MVKFSTSVPCMAKLLQQGEIVAIPTETVYGLAADATNPEAIVKIYEAKQRPRFNPLIAHVNTLEQAEQEVCFTPMAYQLAQKFWPGPVTLIMKARADSRICSLARAGMPTQAIRIPAHSMARELLNTIQVPLVAPSANSSGTLSPVIAEHVAKSLQGKIGWVLDGGKCQEGLESTIIDATGEQPVILRAGTVTAQQIAEACGVAVRLELHSSSETRVRSPGQLLRHYAPRCGLRLGVEAPIPGEALLGFGNKLPSGFSLVKNLSETGEMREAAANLFNYLHLLEESGASRIAAMLLPEHGLGIAINDRLRRAAQGS